MLFFFFFFSSRRRHTRLVSDWSSDVCSSDLALAPFRDTVERLRQVPGLSTTAAEVLIAEIGLEMSRFPTAGHLLSWAGLVPGLDESAGKRRSTRVTKGAPWLKPVLVQCAWAAARK